MCLERFLEQHSKNFYQPCILKVTNTSVLFAVDLEVHVIAIIYQETEDEKLVSVSSSSCRSAEHVSERQAESFQHILSSIEAMIRLSIIFSPWAEERGAVHRGGTAQKLFHGDAGAERTL